MTPDHYCVTHFHLGAQEESIVTRRPGRPRRASKTHLKALDELFQSALRRDPDSTAAKSYDRFLPGAQMETRYINSGRVSQYSYGEYIKLTPCPELEVQFPVLGWPVFIGLRCA